MTSKPITRRIKGDWTVDGFISNLNRPKELEVIVVGGKLYEVLEYGNVSPDPIEITPDGLVVDGIGVRFLPDAGEMERIGL